MTNEEKFFETLQKIIDYSDDPRIVIQVNIGMQLSEYIHKETDDEPTKSEIFNANIISNVLRREPSSKARSKSE